MIEPQFIAEKVGHGPFSWWGGEKTTGRRYPFRLSGPHLTRRAAIRGARRAWGEAHKTPRVPGATPYVVKVWEP